MPQSLAHETVFNLTTPRPSDGSTFHQQPTRNLNRELQLHHDTMEERKGNRNKKKVLLMVRRSFRSSSSAG